MATVILRLYNHVLYLKSSAPLLETVLTPNDVLEMRKKVLLLRTEMYFPC